MDHDINDLARQEVLEQFLSPWKRYRNWDKLVFEIRYKHKENLNYYSGQLYTYPVYRTIPELLEWNETCKIAVRTYLGYNTYIGAHPRYKKLGRKCGHNEDISECYSLYMDADEWTAETIDGHLHQYELPQPTATVSSGNGLHLWWMLKEPINPQLGQIVQRYLIKIIMNRTRISQEGACDLARLLRLPDTLNWKDKDAPKKVNLIDVQPLNYNWLDILGGCHPQWKDDPEIINYQWSEPVVHVCSARAETRGARLQRAPDVLDSGRKRENKNFINSSLSCFTFYEEDKKTIQIIINKAKIVRPCTRNKVIARLVAQLRKQFSDLDQQQLEWIHGQWFKRYKLSMSGQHSEQSSLMEFVYCWEKMSTVGKTAVQFHEELKIEQHPLTDQLSGSRNMSARQLAAIIFTGCKRVEFQKYGYYLSVETARELLSVGSKNTAWRIIQKLMLMGLITRTRNGDRKNRKAAYYAIPKTAQSG